MSENKIHFKVLTHEKVVFEDDVDAIYTVGENGEFGVLPNHVPYMAALKIGVTRVEKDGKQRAIATMGGVFQVKNNDAMILASIAEMDSEIDVARAKEAKERAEARLGSEETELDKKRAEIALAKAMARLAASSKKS